MEYAFYYGRVSTAGQNPDRQYAEAAELGIPKERTFIDVASGRTFAREQYQALTSQLRPGDTLYIASLDRLGRSYKDTMQEYRHLTETLSVKLLVLDMPILSSATDDPTQQLINDLVVQLLTYVADTEYRHIRERQQAGIEAAKAQGVYTGRQPKKFDREKFMKLCAEVDSGERTVTVAAKRLGISRNTFYRRKEDLKNHTGIFADDYED